MSASKDRKIVEMHAKISALQAERDALCQQQADDAKSLTAAANTIRELRAERNNWHVAADIELAKAITAEAELRGCTENLNDSCTTLAKVEAERDALAVENLTLRNAAVNAEERSEEEITHGHVMGRIAIALFGDRNNRTDEECVAKVAEVVYERDNLRKHLHDEHQRHIGTMNERDALAALLRELVALVRGECPSLLNEDSGGDAKLSCDIDAALGKDKP